MIIAANWKAYVEDLSRAKKLLTIAKRRANEKKHEIILAPNAPFFGWLASHNAHSAVKMSAQDVSLTTGGARTGESTAQAFSGAGAAYAIVGHSERRAAGDTNAIVSEKLAHILAQGLLPILCIGEQTRDSDGRYLSFIREELTSALASLSVKDASRLTIAHEPIWAIGKTANEAMTTADLTEMTLYIRKVLAGIAPGVNVSRIRILYGGSVEPANIRSLSLGTGIDGFLIGHASVDPVSFSSLISSVS